MTLDEIRVLLRFRDSPGEDCGVVNRLLDAHIGHVEELSAARCDIPTLRRQGELYAERLRERARAFFEQWLVRCGL